MLKEMRRVKNYEFAEMLPFVMEFLPLCTLLLVVIRFVRVLNSCVYQVKLPILRWCPSTTTTE